MIPDVDQVHTPDKYMVASRRLSVKPLKALVTVNGDLDHIW
jgi:hypothetical protein